MQICEYFFENACYSVTKYYLCKQNNKRSLLGRKQQSQVARSFPNRYLFSYTNKVTSLFSISCILDIILLCKRCPFVFAFLLLLFPASYRLRFWRFSFVWHKNIFTILDILHCWCKCTTQQRSYSALLRIKSPHIYLSRYCIGNKGLLILLQEFYLSSAFSYAGINLGSFRIEIRYDLKLFFLWW